MTSSSRGWIGNAQKLPASLALGTFNACYYAVPRIKGTGERSCVTNSAKYMSDLAIYGWLRRTPYGVSTNQTTTTLVRGHTTSACTATSSSSDMINEARTIPKLPRIMSWINPA